MTNTVSVLMYLPTVIINLFLLVFVVTKKEKLYPDRLFILLCLIVLGWQIAEILLNLLHDPYQVSFAYAGKYIFAAFTIPIYYLLVAGFYHVNKLFSKKFVIFILIPSALTALAAAASIIAGLYLKNFTAQAIDSLAVLSAAQRICFLLNSTLCMLPLVGAALILITQRLNLPEIYRSSAHILQFGLIVLICGNIVEIFKPDGGNTLDMSLLGMCVNNLLFYIAASSGRADYLNAWKRDLFDCLDEAVLTVDANGLVIEANRPALDVLGRFVPELVGAPADTLFDAATEQGRTVLREIRNNDNQLIGHDLYIINVDYPLIYNIQRQDIPNISQAGRGMIMTFTDVTDNRLLIERLNESAGVDSLTGLKNRFGYEQALRAIDIPENLPLSIVIGDVNGLKILNDTHGHQAGDLLLKKVSEMLSTAFPKNYDIARIGGDEFVILLKKCTEAQVCEKICALQKMVERATDFPFPFSVAIGSATKTHPSENINLLFQKADARMYSDKKDWRDPA